MQDKKIILLEEIKDAPKIPMKAIQTIEFFKLPINSTSHASSQAQPHDQDKVSRIISQDTSSRVSNYQITMPYLGAEIKAQGGHGDVLIMRLTDNQGTATKVGLKEGDIIGLISIDTRILSFYSINEFLNVWWNLKLGDAGVFSITRANNLIRIPFKVEVKTSDYYLPTTLKKCALNNTDAHKRISLLHTDDYWTGIAKHKAICDNFISYLGVPCGSQDEANQKSDTIIASLYDLYDKGFSTASNNLKSDLDLYVLTNDCLYHAIVKIISKAYTSYLSNDNSAKKEIEDHRFLMYSIHKLIGNHFVPNYPSLDNISNIATQSEFIISSINSDHTNIITSINNKHKQDGGWKYLKWGMTIDEVSKLIAEYDHKHKLRLIDNEYLTLRYWEDESFIPNGITEYRDGIGSLYFFENVLFGRTVDIAFHDYTHNNKDIIDALSNDFPDGKIYKSLGPGLSINEFYHFKYDSDRMRVFTRLVPPGYAGGGVYYYDTEILNRLHTLTSKELEQKEEQRKRKLLDKLK
jgi:hypothetical protein